MARLSIVGGSIVSLHIDPRRLLIPSDDRRMLSLVISDTETLPTVRHGFGLPDMVGYDLGKNIRHSFPAARSPDPEP